MMSKAVPSRGNRASAYSPPTLTIYGGVTKLTASGTITGTENGGNGKKT